MGNSQTCVEYAFELVVKIDRIQQNSGKSQSSLTDDLLS